MPAPLATFSNKEDIKVLLRGAKIGKVSAPELHRDHSLEDIFDKLQAITGLTDDALAASLNMHAQRLTQHIIEHRLENIVKADVALYKDHHATTESRAI